MYACRECGHIRNVNSCTALAIPLPIVAIPIEEELMEKEKKIEEFSIYCTELINKGMRRII